MTPDKIQHGLELALALHQQGRLAEAIQLYDAIITLEPRHPDALHLLGVAQHQSGDSERGVSLIKAAIGRSKKRPEFHNNLGQALEALGRTAEAERAYRQALALDRSMTDALSNLGAILLERGRLPDAVRALSKAVRLDPNHAMGLMNLGNAKRAEGQPEIARDLHQRAANAMPGSDKAWVNLATSCMDLQQLDAASLALKRALILSPGLIESWNNLGFLYINDPDYPAAERCFRAALQAEPRYAAPHAGLAEIDFLQDRVDLALEHSARALELTQGDPHMRTRRSIQLLASGRIKDGWALRDARLEAKDAIEHRKRPPRWNGEPPAGRSLVITAEEGIGDELLFASCFNDAIAATGACFIECDARLVTLFQRSFPGATIAPFQRSGNRFKPVQTYDWLPRNPPVDLAIEAGSLFQHFRPDLRAYDACRPYLAAEPGRISGWRDRLAALGPGLKIGFTWRSKELTRFRGINYTVLDDWAGLFARPRTHFISMQYGSGWAEEIVDARERLGCEITVFEDADLSDDFETIAALAAALDLIICPSSTVSWIGGGLGVPTWVVHVRPNFTRLGTDHFPGFPSMRSFSKHVLEPWSVCFDAVTAALDEFSGPGR